MKSYQEHNWKTADGKTVEFTYDYRDELQFMVIYWDWTDGTKYWFDFVMFTL